MRRLVPFAFALSLSVGRLLHAQAAAPAGDWRVTGSAPANDRYSALDQINRTNVKQLQVAWTFHTGDSLPERSEIQATPIVVDGVMYTTTPRLYVVALRANDGVELWRFDPFAGRSRDVHSNRGVVFWGAGADRRIFFTAARRLYSLDASTGRPVRTFGDSGWIDLSVGLGRRSVMSGFSPRVRA